MQRNQLWNRICLRMTGARSCHTRLTPLVMSYQWRLCTFLQQVWCSLEVLVDNQYNPILHREHYQRQCLQPLNNQTMWLRHHCIGKCSLFAMDKTNYCLEHREVPMLIHLNNPFACINSQLPLSLKKSLLCSEFCIILPSRRRVFLSDRHLSAHRLTFRKMSLRRQHLLFLER